MSRSKNVFVLREDNVIFNAATGETELNYYIRLELCV